MSECCDLFAMVEDNEDSFAMWQGLVGPYYTPSLSPDGVLSWSNTGGLSNPPPQSIKGPRGDGLKISGLAASAAALPSTASQGDFWLVGTAAPYTGYVRNGSVWVSVGPLQIGPQGPDGAPGAVFLPSISAAGVLSWTNNGGLDNPPPRSVIGPQGPQGDPGQVLVFSVNGKQGAVVLGADDVSAIGTLRGTAIPAGADLNDYTELGSYYVASDATAPQIANIPETGAGGILKVIQGNVGSPIHRIQIYLVSGYNSAWLFMRRYYNGTWGSWYQFTNSYVASGTVTGNGVTARWYRNGRNCFVSVSGTLSAAVAANAAILSGLPAAIDGAWVRTSGNIGLSVGSAGSLRPAADMGQGTAVYVSLSYITAT